MSPPASAEAAVDEGAVRPARLVRQLFAKRRAHHVHARLDELVEFAPVDGSTEELVFWFVRLMAWARPRASERLQSRARFLAMHLGAHPDSKTRFTGALTALAERVDVHSFLAYGGIARDFHLAGALSQWLVGHVLPIACRTVDVEQIVCLSLREQDLAWVRASGIVPLLSELLPDAVHRRFAHAASEALVDLAHQVSAQAHSPSVGSLDSDARAPFRSLYAAVAAFVAAPDDVRLMRALRDRLGDCQRARAMLRSQLAARGADLNTTFSLLRIGSQLERIGRLTAALHEGASVASRIVSNLVRKSLHNARAKRLVARSSELVIHNLVDSTADVGDSYVDDRNSSFRSALLAGAGGGALMVLATVVKFGLAALHLPTAYEGLVFSLNYAGVFCAAYLLHYVIATKLPAHTAAALARSVQVPQTRRARIAAFTNVLRALIRVQLGGLLGNLIVAGPLAYGVAIAFRAATGHPLIGVEKTHHVLSENSLLGPSALYAALTGVFLWLSSLAGAAVDNWARINDLGAALATGVPVMKTVGARRAEPTARRVAARVGGLFGNAFLGFLLGGVPAAFAIGALPVQIRHVTVSTGSVAIAMENGAGDSRAVALALAGVLVIGLVNVAVSFALALWLALRASEDTRTSKTLVLIGLRRVGRRRAPAPLRDA